MKWEKVSFGELFDYENKSKIKAGDGLSAGEYPFYTSSVELSKYLDEFQFDKTSLILGTGGNPSIHYCNTPFSVSTDCLVAFPKNINRVNTRFVYYYISGNINLLEEGFRGAGLKHISKTYINEIDIPLPPLEVQKQIATTLDKADELRKKDELLLKKYDELAQSIFYDIFGDPVKNEKGWEKEKLKNLGVVKTGNTPPRVDVDNYGNDIEWIKTDNIILNFEHPLKASEYLSLKGEKIGRTVDKGSILVTCIAGSTTSIGNCVLTDRKVAFNQQINSFTPSKNQDIYFSFRLFRECKKIIQDSTTSGMKRIITKGVFEQLEFINPPIELQKKFTERVKLAANGKVTLQKEINLSNKLFESLINNYFA